MSRSDEQPYRSGGCRSLAGFGIAVVGTFIGFLPLFQIMLPLKAAAIAHGSGALLPGPVAAWDAAVAGAGNLVIGWLSDRASSRLGRRRPWIIDVGDRPVSYAPIWQARSGMAPPGSTALFRVPLDAVSPPLLALVPDRVPPADRSRASAPIGLGKPLGPLIGTVVIGTTIVEQDMRFLVLGGIVAPFIVPFALRAGGDPAPAVHDPRMPAAPGAARQ